MTKEDLKNTKIYLSNEEDVIKFQEKVFKLGIKCTYPDWGNPFIYIDESLSLYMDIERDFATFCASRNKQIFLEDILEIKEPKKEHKFKPYDKVLVRDHKSQRWCPTLYSYYDSEYAFHHVTVADIIYKYCIPYEGNEHLVGTTNSK